MHLNKFKTNQHLILQLKISNIICPFFLFLAKAKQTSLSEARDEYMCELAKQTKEEHEVRQTVSVSIVKFDIKHTNSENSQALSP